MKLVNSQALFPADFAIRLTDAEWEILRCQIRTLKSAHGRHRKYLPRAFTDFFHALWGYEPFPWQVEFAARLCAGKAPDSVAVPTGSGKSACLDAARGAFRTLATLPATGGAWMPWVPGGGSA